MVENNDEYFRVLDPKFYNIHTIVYTFLVCGFKVLQIAPLSS